MAIIYAIKEGWTIGKIPSHLFGILLLIIPVFLSWLSLALSRFLGAESPVVNCKEFNLADGEFLPIYLGYFFVSVGVSEHFTMAVVYLIVFVFTFLSQTQYYNPIYLLFGYHYYCLLYTSIFLFSIQASTVSRLTPRYSQISFIEYQRSMVGSIKMSSLSGGF